MLILRQAVTCQPGFESSLSSTTAFKSFLRSWASHPRYPLTPPSTTT